ncbi:hypothetical protein SAMN05880566_1413 [Janthinobacterium sp. TND4EL3]|nr:hypothetical protein SAMN05880566_1413 [Janthinobacterium sp. TND4EL3]
MRALASRAPVSAIFIVFSLYAYGDQTATTGKSTVVSAMWLV